MFSPESRPLRRPKLGVPDFYPQGEKQKEDELSYHTLNSGFRLPLAVQDEVGSALKDFSQHLNTKEYSTRVNQVLDNKRRAGFVHDSTKRKLPVTKDNFFPVPLGRNRKEIAQSWFQDLAGSKPLSTLAKKVPVFNKKEEIFENFCEKDVPIFRAVWYIKMTALYNSTIPDSKLNKKKQTNGPSFDWTLSLTHYMQERAWRASASNVSGRGSSTSGGGGANTPSDECLEEVHRWKYMVNLSSWLYQENLLDKHEFLQWLVERVGEHIRRQDSKSVQLYLSLVLKYLLDIGSCVSLSRSLVNCCSQQLTRFYELDQRLQKTHQPPALPPSTVQEVQVKSEPNPLQTPMETNEEEDNVFNDPPAIKIKPDPDQKPPAPHEKEKAGTWVKKETNSAAVTDGQRSGEVPAITVDNEEEHPSAFHWCSHHHSLMLQLSCVLQTIAIQCPTAFVNANIKGKSGTSLLSQLPTCLAELPMPSTLEVELNKKLLQVLGATEQEIHQRNKAAESGWSAMTVADLQTTSEGANVQKVLKIIDVLDGHNFTSCRGHNTLTTLYVRITAIQLEAEVPLGDDMLAMLLCQWAVTPHRAGHHRPIVAAKLLSQRQAEILKGEPWKECTDLEKLDESWEEISSSPSRDIRDFPFQQTLFTFLDSRAPLPEDLSAPLKSTEPFFQLVSLFSNLIHHNVFSYSLYLSLLIAKGEVQSPIIPLLPFAREGECVFHPRPEPEPELSLSIPLPALKKARLDPGGQATPTGPASPSTVSEFSIGVQQDISFTSALNMIGGGGSIICETENSAGKVEENVALLRQQQLESLLTADHEPSRLVSPLAFHSQDDRSSSPMTAFLPFTSSSTLFIEEEQNIEASLNKQSQRHLLFSVYFPLSDSHLTKQELSERSVVLCGVGKSRNRVEKIVKNIMENVEHYFRLLSQVSSPVLPENARCPDLMQKFCLLPTFEQRVIATECERRLRASLSEDEGAPSKSICAQLVFVCELLEISGGISQILDLLVDIIAGDQPEEKTLKGGMERTSLPPPLPPDLCLPVTCLLRKYLSCLLLSQQDTTTVFESLCRVLEGLRPSAKINSSQRTIFLFLHQLYTNCSFLQKTCRMVFGPLLMQLGRDTPFGGSILTESYAPTNTDTPFQRTGLASLVTQPSECDKVCNFIIRGNTFVSYPKTISLFVMDVFATVIQKNANSHSLCDLAKVCAEVCCSVGSQVNKELMGAFRALCLPMTKMKFCVTGFTNLTDKSNILLDPGIQSNLISFAALLVANGCFFLHDIISYIIQPIIHVQTISQTSYSHTCSSKDNTISLKFICSLILSLLVDDHINRPHTSDTQHLVNHPLFVRHYLHARARELDFAYLISLLKNLLHLYHSLSRAFGGMRGGMQVVIQPESHQAVLEELHSTLETLATQDWVREKCIQQSGRLLDADQLGDRLIQSQARYLLSLLCPYGASGVTTTDKSLPLHTMDSATTVEHVLKNLDQWTLRSSLIHINLHIAQTSSNSTRIALLDDLASRVIQVFEDSCGEEWLGQIESSVENGDGAYSPSVWLVTPLVSRLQQSVLGRVLKCAGHVLGQGQWWNPEKSQEKRRSTRATSGVAPPKTGLQWQQPFLELVLACMNTQATTHEELLGPLRTQLQSFLAAFDREGMPGDEQSKTMLYAALKLRLSLVGSMLATICTTESTTLEWTALLMQLICSGAVDRQTDSSELFTNCLDMLATLLHSLHPDFHICLAGSGEEGKKAYTTCIKKLKSELSSAKSSCLPEIQQLFPLVQRPYEIITVKPPAFNLPKPAGEKIVGLRIQDSREISPWDILEGVKNAGPLMLSWFGAVRMKRKPLKYVEQKRLVHFHSHQKRFGDMLSRRHFVSLPDPTPQADPTIGAGPSGPNVEADTPTTSSTKLPVAQPTVPDLTRRPADMRGGNVGPRMPTPLQINPIRPKLPAPMPQVRGPAQQTWQRAPQPPKQLVNDTLQKIKDQQMTRLVSNPYTMQPSMYPRHPMNQVTMHAQPQMSGYNPNITTIQQHQQQQLKMRLMQMPQDQRQLYLQQLRTQRARQMMMSHQYPPQYQQMGHPHMGQPMQAAPPMPMQTMQHSYPPQQMMVRQQYAQHPAQTMNIQQRPMY